MSFPSNAPFSTENYSSNSGVSFTSPFIPVLTDVDPTIYDINYPVKKRWINTTVPKEWILTGFSTSTGQLLANWLLLSQGPVLGFEWIDQATSTVGLPQIGYFCTAALTITLPASPEQGNAIAIFADTASSVTIQAQSDQYIRLGNQISSLAGSFVSTKQGDIVELIYRAATHTWNCIDSVGNFTIN